MKRNYFILIILVIFSSILKAQEDSEQNKLSELIDNTEISGQWFLAHEYNITEDINQFKLKRGYFTFKTKLNEKFSVRYTQDITLDEEGDDAGNVEMRLKYLYIAMDPFEKGFFDHFQAEFGLIHRPWLDYEQSINPYRVQGRMFAERYHMLNSADFGIAFSGLIGGKMDEKYQKNIDKKYPGRYGSYAFGVYNGPGYHAAEMNNNKTVEGRISLRPLPKLTPGLQFTYAFIFGNANIPDNKAKFNMNVFFVSQQSKYLTLTLQYLTGTGNSSGSLYIPAEKDSYKNQGVSLFGEFKIPNTNFAVFWRYDDFANYYKFPQLKSELEYETAIAGLSYRFLKNKIVLDYNQFIGANGEKEEQVELAVEVKF